MPGQVAEPLLFCQRAQSMQHRQGGRHVRRGVGGEHMPCRDEAIVTLAAIGEAAREFRPPAFASGKTNTGLPQRGIKPKRIAFTFRIIVARLNERLDIGKIGRQRYAVRHAFGVRQRRPSLAVQQRHQAVSQFQIVRSMAQLQAQRMFLQAIR